jgi:hypothetical protein
MMERKRYVDTQIRRERDRKGAREKGSGRERERVCERGSEGESYVHTYREGKRERERYVHTYREGRR